MASGFTYDPGAGSFLATALGSSAAGNSVPSGLGSGGNYVDYYTTLFGADPNKTPLEQTMAVMQAMMTIQNMALQQWELQRRLEEWAYSDVARQRTLAVEWPRSDIAWAQSQADRSLHFQQMAQQDAENKVKQRMEMAAQFLMSDPNLAKAMQQAGVSPQQVIADPKLRQEVIAQAVNLATKGNVNEIDRKAMINQYNQQFDQILSVPSGYAIDPTTGRRYTASPSSVGYTQPVLQITDTRTSRDIAMQTFGLIDIKVNYHGTEPDYSNWDPSKTPIPPPKKTGDQMLDAANWSDYVNTLYRIQIAKPGERIVSPNGTIVVEKTDPNRTLY